MGSNSDISKTLYDIDITRHSFDLRSQSLTNRYYNGESQGSDWHRENRYFNQLVDSRVSSFGKLYPQETPWQIQESLSSIAYRRIEYYQDIGWDVKASNLTDTFLKTYPHSSYYDVARERFQLRRAESPLSAFFHTAFLEASKTPILLSILGGALGSALYFARSNRLVGTVLATRRLKIFNPSLLLATSAGVLLVTALYALRPSAPKLAQFGIAPGRTWRAAESQHLYGKDGDLVQAGIKNFVTVGVATLTAVIFSRQIAAGFLFFFHGSKTGLKQAFAEPASRISKGVMHHVNGTRDTLIQMKGESGNFVRSLKTADRWKKIGKWFVSPNIDINIHPRIAKILPSLKPQHVNFVANNSVRLIRVGGGMGLVLNASDRFLSDEFKEGIAGYQTFRMIGGVMMNLALVEFTCTTMGLLRIGAYLNAASEFLIDLNNQFKTTETKNISYFRIALPIFRTAVYKKALDIGLNLSRARRLGILPRAGETWFSESFTQALHQGVRAQSRGARLLTSLEATPVATALMLIPYGIEALLGRVNYGNFAYARMEQMMWPGIPMLFVAGWTGNFTSLSSILINKFVLNPTFGQGSWNMHGRYSGEDAGLHSFINDLRALDPNSKDFVKERNRLVRHHTIKKGGHIEGGFGSFGSFFMSLDTLYDQIVGYLFACYYSLSNDDQPLGSSLDKMHIRLFSGVNMLFTPEYGFYRTFYSSLHDPKKHLDGGKDDREFILEQINAYLLSNPINSKEPAPLDVEGWENWAFVRNLAILSFLASENTMTPLENNPELEKVRQTALWYLQGTEKLSKEKQLKVALSRLSREASIRFQGRTAYGVF